MKTNGLILTVVAAALAGCASTAPEPRVRLDPSEPGLSALLARDLNQPLPVSSSAPVSTMAPTSQAVVTLESKPMASVPENPAPVVVGTGDMAPVVVSTQAVATPGLTTESTPVTPQAQTDMAAVAPVTGDSAPNTQEEFSVKDAIAKAGTMEPVTRVSNGGVDAAQAAYASGKDALGRRSFDEAIVLFRSARTMTPGMVDAHVGLGVAMSMSGRHDESVASFERAVELEPANAKWHANLGMAYARTGKFGPAQESLAKAWSLKPDDKRIEAQLTRVTAAARAAGIAPVASVQTAAPVSEESSLHKVRDRVFDLKLAGAEPVFVETAPVVAAAPQLPPIRRTAPVQSTQWKAADESAPITFDAPVITRAPVTTVKTVQKVAPIAMTKPRAVAQLPVVEKAPVAKAPVLKVPAAKAVATPPVVKPTVVAKAPVAGEPVKVARAVPAVKKPFAPTMKIKARRVKGMIVVGGSKAAASSVAKFLSSSGLRSGKVGAPVNTQPLTEIHYRPGYERDVQDIRLALPVRSYTVPQNGLPKGINVKLIVGRDLAAAAGV